MAQIYPQQSCYCLQRYVVSRSLSFTLLQLIIHNDLLWFHASSCYMSLQMCDFLSIQNRKHMEKQPVGTITRTTLLWISVSGHLHLTKVHWPGLLITQASCVQPVLKVYKSRLTWWKQLLVLLIFESWTASTVASMNVMGRGFTCQGRKAIEIHGKNRHIISYNAPPMVREPKPKSGKYPCVEYIYILYIILEWLDSKIKSLKWPQSNPQRTKSCNLRD